MKNNSVEYIENERNHKNKSYLFLIHWIISAFAPWIAPEYPPSPLHDSFCHSFFLNSLHSIVATARYMLAIRRSIHGPSPDGMIGGEVFLIDFEYRKNELFHKKEGMKK